MPGTTLNRIPIFDGVRGYASLWVMFGHFSTRTGLWIAVLDSPGIAVDLFMIVSGFLMTQHFFARRLSEPWESPSTWVYFYLRRFFRIAPLYYILLIPSFLGFNYLQDAQRETLRVLLNIDYHPAVPVDAANILTHVSFVFGLFPNYCTVLSMPDWSLSLEMQFYAVFPLLMFLARRVNIVRLGLLIILVWFVSRAIHDGVRNSASLLSVFSLASFLPLQLGIFFVGMLLAWAWMEARGRLTTRALFLLLCAAVIAASAKDQFGSALTGVILAGMTLLLALLLFHDGVAVNVKLERLICLVRTALGNRIARFLADISYGVYLVHLLVMIPILRMLCAAPSFVRQPASLRFLILASICGPITVVLASILSRAVEQPGIRLGKTLVDRSRRAKRTQDREQLVAS